MGPAAVSFPAVCGSSVVAFLFCCVSLSAVGFFAGRPISSLHFAAAGLTVLFVLWASTLIPRRGKTPAALGVFVFLLASFFLSWLIARSFFDLSYDGQAYHQEAIFHLSSGWNPFTQPLSDGEVNRMGRWLQHYSKAVWIWETGFLKAAGEIEAAKLFHLWLMGAAFCLSFTFLTGIRALSRATACLVSLLIAFNPVSIYQSLSFYLDGQLMSLTVILIATLALIYRNPNRFYYVLLFMTVSILVNVKLTAQVYTVILLSGYVFIVWVRRRRDLLPPFSATTAGALLA
ncbi:MAG TPA: hypothetical protein VLS90_17990, partial [Thermodesulfobacteriota bacterium]|nr:hypothetical protein [Thermodesulfobacteriota bacterium]